MQRHATDGSSRRLTDERQARNNSDRGGIGPRASFTQVTIVKNLTGRQTATTDDAITRNSVTLCRVSWFFSDQ